MWVGHEGGVLCLEHEGVLVSGSADRTARLWSEHGQTDMIFAGHADDVTSLKIHEASKLFTGSDDHSTKAWSLATGACLAIYTPPCSVGVTCLSSDSLMVYAGFKDGTVCTFNLVNCSDD